MDIVHIGIIAAMAIVIIWGFGWYLLIKAKQRKSIKDANARQCKYKINPEPGAKPPEPFPKQIRQKE
ncbi:MAG: hypothetical protein WC805_00830 [Patescibacteria group bacterium]|jgi:hypothetical protein